jgi:hypothetical protein
MSSTEREFSHSLGHKRTLSSLISYLIGTNQSTGSEILDVLTTPPSEIPD